jgi:nucleoside-diphosphate-sugar epimerase
MKIAVTGGSGFLGTHVLAQLVHGEDTVVAAARDAGRIRVGSGRVHVVSLDITQAEPSQYVQLGRPDVLIHLAWEGLPNYKSLHHFETELPRQYRFLQTMVDQGLPALVVAGTCFEYGFQSGCLSEDMPTNPNNPYGHAKDALRRQLEFLRDQRPYCLTWARLFYMFGPGQAQTSLYAKLEDAVSRGAKSFDMSGGEQLRDYLPVDAVARHLVSLARCENNAGLVNVCSGEPISVRTLAERWVRERGWQISLDFGRLPYPDYESMAFWGDNRRLRSLSLR